MLIRPTFVAAVLVLAVNDHFLKPVFNNWFTGKLSDVSGLFAVTVLAIALAPRFRAASSIIIVVAFTWWKSPMSSILIDTWNSVGPWQIGRTPDYSDLIALPAVAAAVLYARQHDSRGISLSTTAHRHAITVVAALSLVVFVATSYRSTVPYGLGFSYPGTQVQLVSALEAVGVSVNEGTESSQFVLWIPSDFCFDRVYASVELQPSGEVTILRLHDITHHCPRARRDARQLLEIFHDQVVTPLQLRPIEGA